MLRRCLYLTLGLCLCLCLIMQFSPYPLVARADADGAGEAPGPARLLPGTHEEGDYTYQLTEGGDAVITRYNGKESFIATPQTLGGHQVTEIGNSAFANAKATLRRLTISEGVKILRGKALLGFSFGSARVELPSTLEYVGADAFSGTGVEKMSFPDGLKVIEDRAFADAISIAGLYIPPSVHEIGKYAFMLCDSLTIYGAEGSYAQAFAEENGIPFVVGLPTDEAVNVPPDTDIEAAMSRHYKLSPEDHARLHSSSSAQPPGSDLLKWIGISGWALLAAFAVVSALYFRKRGATL